MAGVVIVPSHPSFSLVVPQPHPTVSSRVPWVRINSRPLLCWMTVTLRGAAAGFCLSQGGWLRAEHCSGTLPMDFKGSIFGLPRALPLNHRRQGWKRPVRSHPVLSSCQRRALLHRNMSQEHASCVASALASLEITDKPP